METTGNSEIVRFLQEMEQHYAATQYGLSGLAVGTIRHSFITTRMERMGCTHEEWQRLVRPEQAIALVAETLQAQGATRHGWAEPQCTSFGETCQGERRCSGEVGRDDVD